MKIDHKEPRLRKVGNLFTLMPGINQVEEGAFTKAMRLPAFAALVDGGVIEVLDKDASGDLSKLGAKKALALVGRTVDRDLLSTWLKTEKRAEVQEAIAKQLEAVKPDPPKGEGEGKDAQ